MAEVTAQDLENMSPEERAAFKKKNCFFCQITSGAAESKKVYEDELCIGILDINPAKPGHVLIIPKEHYDAFPLMPSDLSKHLFIIAKKISLCLLKVLKASGTNIFIANGKAAGQTAPHAMIHIIPRNDEDTLNVFNLEQHDINPQDQEKIWRFVKVKVDEVLNSK